MEAIGLAGISGHFLQPLGEDRPFAPEVVAEKTAHAKADASVEGYGYAMAGQGSYGAGVAAVYPAGPVAAHGTRCAGGGGAEVDMLTQ